MTGGLETLLAGALIALLSGGIGVAGSLTMFHINRESNYHQLLADSYSELFSQYRPIRSAMSRQGDRVLVAAAVYSAIYKVRVVDRDEARLKLVGEIRGATKVLIDHSPDRGTNLKSDDRQDENIGRILVAMDELINSLRKEIIHKRPVIAIFPD